jgi:hypothetical protein
MEVSNTPAAMMVEFQPLAAGGFISTTEFLLLTG